MRYKCQIGPNFSFFQLLAFFIDVLIFDPLRVLFYQISKCVNIVLIILTSIHNYLFLQRQFHRTNPLMHMNARLQFANTKIISLYYLKFSYIINPDYCGGTLRNFNSIENYFLFIPLREDPKTNPRMGTLSTHIYLFQPSLSRLDCGQFGESRAGTREASDFGTSARKRPHCNTDLYP